MKHFVGQFLFLSLFISQSAFAVSEDRVNLSLNIDTVLTLEQIQDPQKCEEELGYIETNLETLNEGLDNPVSGNQGELNLPELLCKHLLEASKKKQKEDDALASIYKLVGEEIPATVKKTRSALLNALSKWEFSINLSGAVYSGNTDYMMAENSIGAVGNFGFHTIKVEAKGQYRSEDEDDFKKFNINVRDEIDLGRYGSIPNSMGGFVSSDFTIDENKGIKAQLDVLAGVGYNVFGDYSVDNNTVLKINMAIGYRVRKNQDNTSVKAPIVSTSIRFERALNSDVTFNTEAVYKRKIQGSSSDYDVKASTALKYAIGEDSTIALRYEYVYESNPMPGKEKLDSVFKIEYEKKF